MIEKSDGLVAEPLLRLTAGGAKRLVEIRYEGDDGPARRRPKYASSLFRIAFRILDLPPTDYHIKLSDLYSTEDGGSVQRRNLEKACTQVTLKAGGRLGKTFRSRYGPHASRTAKCQWSHKQRGIPPFESG